NPLATSDSTATEFLKWERFHRRGRSDRNTALTPQTPTPYDFQETVALAGDFTQLPRLLGLVLDLTFPSTRVLFGAGSSDTRVRVVPTWTPLLANPPDPDSVPFTRCRVGGGDASHAPAFVAIPKNAADTDYVDRWLNLGDTSRFDVFDVDVDGGASRSRGFADNVSRSRKNHQKYSFATPDRYALPHHSSAGLQVARFDRATQTTTMFANHLALNSQLVDSNGDPNPGTPPDLFLEDLVRGFRVDVNHTAGFLSVMRRTGQYHFLNQGGAGDVDIEEEGIVSGGVTSAGGTDGDAKDIYQGETLVRWKGWSLANHLIGQAVGPDDQPSDGTEDQSNIPFLSTFSVPPGTLPRLRFGQSYQLRARAVDLAGNSPAPEDTEPAGAATARTTFHRYEPVASPVVVYCDVPAVPLSPGLHDGETAEIVVIRSENGASPDAAAGTSRRHLLPPKVAQGFAELHGVLDTGGGGALDKTVYDHIAALDAGDLANHPDGVDDPTTPGSKAFPVDHLDLDYLPDPLARAAVLRDLPPGGSPATTSSLLLMDPGAWPDYQTWRVDLVGGPASTWDIDTTNRVLTLTLAKADVFEPRVSSALDAPDLDLMGVWAWILAVNSPVPSALQFAAQTGSHWMLTPWRQMKFVHGVRTPLADPNLPEGSFSAFKQQIGDTFAVLQRQLIFHRKSTGRVDIIGNWQMKIDTGPGGADPTIEHDFQAVAGSLTLDRAKADPFVPGQELFTIDHEFGDTKYRLVDYHPVATSAFVELYREYTSVTPTGTDPSLVDARGIEAPTVKVTDPLTDLEFTQARAGMPSTGDYVVDETAGTIARTPSSTMADSQPVNVSYVAQEVNTSGAVRTRVIKSSARPAAPKLKWALPTFTWGGTGSSGDPHTKRGGSVRLYLERPWWSSGDGEQLAVVCWPITVGAGNSQMPKA
ncbi:MAG TPA: hypothetical protein VMT43_14170, partial [Acidimicrobiales bacterium]|nr:hypothetical protein [Acidimicrobiales bacterium]